MPASRPDSPTSPDGVLWLALMVVGTAWGSTQLFSKLIMSQGHLALGVSFLSTVLGAVIVTAVMLFLRVPLPLSRRHLVFFLICGLTGTALPNYTSYTSIRELPVGVVSVIIAAVPIWTFLAAVALKMDRAAPRRVVGLGLGALAVALLIGPEASLPRPEDTLWVGVALLTGLSYTVENIYIARNQPKECGALQTLCGLLWAAVCLIMPVTLGTGAWMEISSPFVDEFALVGMTLCHLLAYGGFVWLISQAGPVFAAQVGYVVTLSGVLLGIVVLGETHSAWVWLSLALMMAGLALVQPRR